MTEKNYKFSAHVALKASTVGASWKVQPKFFKFVVCNPCQSSPSSFLCVLLLSLSCFSIALKLSVLGSINLYAILYAAKTIQNTVQKTNAVGDEGGDMADYTIRIP